MTQKDDANKGCLIFSFLIKQSVYGFTGKKPMTISVRRPPEKSQDKFSRTEQLSLKNKGLNGLIDSLSTDVLFVLTSGSIAVSLLTQTASILEVLSVSLWGFLVLLYLVFHQQTHRQIAQVQRWVAKYGLMPLLTGLLAFIWGFDSLLLPSQALFFDNVRTKLDGMFTGTGYAGASGATTAINIGTYALEALMVGYIVYGVVKAIQSGRDDDDWKQPLKLPLLVLFAVTAGDQTITLL